MSACCILYSPRLNSHVHVATVYYSVEISHGAKFHVFVDTRWGAVKIRTLTFLMGRENIMSYIVHVVTVLR